MNKKIIFFILSIFIIGFLFIWYKNPISEELQCNENYLCKVEHIFAGNIKIENNIYISKNSSLSLTEKYHNSGKGAKSYFTYYVKIMGNKPTKPFIYYNYKVNNSALTDEVDKNFLLYQKTFEQYILNPKNGYKLSSAADSTEFKILSIAWIVFISVLLLWYIFDKKKNPV